MYDVQPFERNWRAEQCVAMAYSRWDQSRWFVFGASFPDAPKEKQELSIHDSGGMIFDYAFSDLESSLPTILKLIQKETVASVEEISELEGYISIFLHEVGVSCGSEQE